MPGVGISFRRGIGPRFRFSVGIGLRYRVGFRIRSGVRFTFSNIMLWLFRFEGRRCALMASLIIDFMDWISNLRPSEYGHLDQIQEECEEESAGEGATDDPDGQGLHRDAANGQRGDDHDVGSRSDNDPGAGPGTPHVPAFAKGIEHGLAAEYQDDHGERLERGEVEA
jgi:hypothetical protein